MVTIDGDEIDDYYDAADVAMAQSERASSGKGGVTMKIRPIAGGSGLYIPDFLNKGSGMTIIRNADNSCGLHCLVVGVATDVKRCNLMKPARASRLNKEVEALDTSIGHAISDPMSLADFDEFVDTIPDHKIVLLIKDLKALLSLTKRTFGYKILRSSSFLR